MIVKKEYLWNSQSDDCKMTIQGGKNGKFSGKIKKYTCKETKEPT